MRAHHLLMALALAFFSGCDSGGETDTGNASCAEFSFRSGGMITADVDGQPLRSDCYNTFVESGLTHITGYEIGASETDLRTPITIVIGGTTEGTYRIGDGSDPSTIQISVGDASDERAESGVIQVTEYSAARLRGTFSFVTSSGVSVSDGTFDVAP
ncbi:hypothetical protein [Rubrivirga sp.]|uniref:hypothetical protein n=1 Tax=Rubrivirga sp. TaxID=1885344 RepID=UPI003C76431F